MSSIIDHSRRISINNTQYTVDCLVNEYLPDNTGTLFLPESQRTWAWNGKRGLAKMQSLVDSVFMGYPIRPSSSTPRVGLAGAHRSTTGATASRRCISTTRISFVGVASCLASSVQMIAESSWSAPSR